MKSADQGPPLSKPLWPAQVVRLRRASVNATLAVLLRRLPSLSDHHELVREALTEAWNDGQADGWYRGRAQLRKEPDTTNKRVR